MKKLLFISVLLFTGVRLMAQSIPDGGFEFWNTATWMDPLGFTTSNAQGNGYNASYGLPANVTQVGGKYGSFGVQVATANPFSELESYLDPVRTPIAKS